ncbi:von Willebrand factor A domain-containing protein 2 isoform X2 [Rhinatrema bivittatum]|uniref:von Willebrand factor A domain-containing protein 2 isoform X2 n=1 Tax=Rhinatrema bivittatum TaxID=194408 RepID=UPI0011292022|nr:von Willebrand factor A domain-containing protein 2 isoform X2 [Rhinatrema bivittatum]
MRHLLQTLAKLGKALSSVAVMDVSSLETIVVLLVSQALLTCGIQELLANRETVLKISAAGQMMQCSASVDILFLLDGSYSIGKGSFERSKHFAIKLCDTLDISPDKVRVGVLQYSASPRLEFPLDAHSTRQEVKRETKNIAFRGGSTETGLALKYVLRKGFPGGRGSSVPKILILLSDGRSQGQVLPSARELKESAVTIFAVGVRFPRWEELHSLASEPVEQHVLSAEHVDDAVNGLSSALTTTSVCSAVPPGCKIELLLCERKTLEARKELMGNYMCWKGAKRRSAGSVALCPFYSWKKLYRKHPSRCYRTVCPDPCDSQPCRNGGTCVPEGLDKYHCVCLVGFGGDEHCDSSSGTTLEGFLRHKSFLKRFIQAALVADSPVNVGVAQYSSDVQVVVKIGEYQNVPELLKQLDALRHTGGSTFIGKALRHVARHGFKSAPAFADIRDDLPRVVVILAGSSSQDPVTEPAKFARDQELTLIGVGGELMKDELNKIATNPQLTIVYANPQDLFNKIPELQRKICSVDSQGCQTPLDLVFTLDGSAGVGLENFNHLKNFIKSASLHFLVNRDVTQIGLVVYGSRPRTAFSLDTHDTHAGILEAVGRTSYVGGLASAGSALLHVYENVMTVQKGARPGVNKVVVLLTDGTGAEDAVVPAQKLRSNGISLFMVGIGEVKRNSLLRIAGSEDYLVQVLSYEDLKYFEDNVVQRVCEEAKRPVDLCRPNPCMNNGACILQRGSYRCQCRDWEGLHCETKISRGVSSSVLGFPAKLYRQRNPSGYHQHHRKA